MTEYIAAAAVGETTKAIGEVGKELAKNEEFAAKAGEAVKSATETYGDLAKGLAYGLKEFLQNEQQYQIQLREKIGDAAIDTIINHPDKAAENYAKAAITATKAATQITEEGKTVAKNIPEIVQQYVYGFASVPGYAAKGFIGSVKTAWESLFKSADELVPSKTGGQQTVNVLGLQFAIALVSLIFIIAVTIWILSSGYKKQNFIPPTLTESVIIGSGVLALILIMFSYFG